MPALSRRSAMTRGARHRRLDTAFVALCLLAVIPLAARAEDSEVTTLRQEVSDLKQVVQHLNERVEGLEQQLSPRSEPGVQAAAAPATPVPRPSAAATPGDSIRDHWHQISRGMTTSEVERLLGRPQRTMKVNLSTVWYYTYPDVGSGSIVFVPEGGVDDWQTPPFNTWW